MRRPRLTYANVVSTLALFLAVASGSAFAVTQLPQNSVGPKQLRKGAVTPAKLSAKTKRMLKGGAVVVGAAGPQGERGPRGETGPQGPTGPATGPAGGSLSGNYPNPAIAPDAIGSAEVAPGSLRLTDLAVGSNTVSFGGVNVAAHSCSNIKVVAMGNFLLGDYVLPVPRNVPNGLIVVPLGIDGSGPGTPSFEVCNVTADVVSNAGLVVDIYILRQ